ncbi:hypothetical protein JCM14076_21050 [Methylosoma difficile]
MKSKLSGFTLIELMVAILLGSLLVAGISVIFLQSKRTFEKQQSLSYMVEDGRYALEIFGKEFRRRGFLVNKQIAGQEAKNIFLTKANAAESGMTLNEAESITGTYNAAGINNAYDTNHVVFRYQLEPGGSCSDTFFENKGDCQNNGAIWNQNNNDKDEGLSACSSQVSDQAGGVTANLKTIAFYVANDASGTPTLYCNSESTKKDGTRVDFANNIELVSNVERLLIVYGLDTDDDGDANKYLPADQIILWSNIVSIRIYLVLMSDQTNLNKSTPSFQIDDTVFNVNDASSKRLYRVFSTTIAFRN